MSRKIRLYTWGDEHVDVCSHIRLNATEEEDDSCEYIEQLEIYCNVCKKTYEFDVLVN